MTNEELKARADRVEHRPGGDYFILSMNKLTGEDFADLIMGEVRELQKLKSKDRVKEYVTWKTL
jgi:hypothetical protein